MKNLRRWCSHNDHIKVLIFGPPGSGKTNLAQLISHMLLRWGCDSKVEIATTQQYVPIPEDAERFIINPSKELDKETT